MCTSIAAGVVDLPCFIFYCPYLKLHKNFYTVIFLVLVLISDHISVKTLLPVLILE